MNAEQKAECIWGLFGQKGAKRDPMPTEALSFCLKKQDLNNKGQVILRSDIRQLSFGGQRSTEPVF